MPSVLIAASFVLFFFPIVFWKIREKFQDFKRRKSDIAKILLFSTFLIFSIWCLKYAAVSYPVVSGGCTDKMILIEKAFESLFEALRTLGVEDKYAEYITSLKEVVAGVTNDNTVVIYIIVAFASMLDFFAPFAGGALVFEILASIFPKVRLKWMYLKFWQKKYFFSELNEASLTLAKGIMNSEKRVMRRPVVIFSDVYRDEDNERKSEILAEAKTIGAICIKDDLSHVKKNRFGERVFFLIDENDNISLQTLTDLADKSNYEFLKKSEIFFITDNDAYIEVEKRIFEMLKKKYYFSKDEMPNFIPVRSSRNLILDMLVNKVPLFEPLIDKENKESLTVTILGTGQIGIEMFLSVYWIGQILNCKLNINVLSMETQTQFWNKIDYINPEIRRTTDKNDPILNYNRKGEKSEEYCNVRYIECDACSSALINALENHNDPKSIIDTDYFFVALGSDKLNISVANTLRKEVAKYHIFKKDNTKAVITYVVYDQTISEIVNKKQLFSSFDSGTIDFVNNTADIIITAVGSLGEMYSVENIFFNKFYKSTKEINESYELLRNRESRKEEQASRREGEYRYWASMAKAMHRKYKMFSAGFLYNSVFNYSDPDDKSYKKSIEDTFDRYEAFIRNDTEQKKEYYRLLDELAWLEHRRWNAFMRVNGFCGTKHYENYAVPDEIGSYKQMEVKLHPCLVECDKKGIRAKRKENGRIDMENLLKSDEEDFDLLDEVSYNCYKKGYNKENFKKYDYPISDF